MREFAPPDGASAHPALPIALGRAMAERGWFMLDDRLPEGDVATLAADLERAYALVRARQVAKGLSPAAGAVHHVLGQGDSFLSFLGRGVPLAVLEALLGARAILNSYGGVINGPEEASYLHRVHRDVRSYTSELVLMLNMIVLLDDFSLDNGATHLLSGSHRQAERPADEAFFREADRLVGPRGSVVLFDSRLWHAAGTNRTPLPRRALTLTFTPPYIKPQLDYPRLLGYDREEAFGAAERQLLGYHARIPASLDEWYQPPMQRFYRPDQG